MDAAELREARQQALDTLDMTKQKAKIARELT
jgi:hypothetical protein